MKTNVGVLKRFIIYMAILTFVMFTVWAFVKSFMNRPPGDYHTEVCDIRLKDKLYDQDNTIEFLKSIGGEDIEVIKR